MLPLSGTHALQSYSSQAKVAEILTSKRNQINFPRLVGADNVDISGRARAIAFSKSFASRLSEAAQASEPATSQAVAANLEASANIQEAIQARRKERQDEKYGTLPKEAALGFSSMTSESLAVATKAVESAREKAAEAPAEKSDEPAQNRYQRRVSINDFSLRFIRALNPIPV